MFSGSDASFDIMPVGGRDWGDVTDGGLWDAVTNTNSGLNRWARYAGWEAVGCMAAAMAFGGPNFTPIKIATIMAAPEIGLGIIGGCSLGAGIGCLGSI